MRPALEDMSLVLSCGALVMDATTLTLRVLWMRAMDTAVVRCLAISLRNWNMGDYEQACYLLWPFGIRFSDFLINTVVYSLSIVTTGLIKLEYCCVSSSKGIVIDSNLHLTGIIWLKSSLQLIIVARVDSNFVHESRSSRAAFSETF